LTIKNEGKSAMNKVRLILAGACAVVLLAVIPVRAEVKTQTVNYKIGNADFEGYLAYDIRKQGKQPGVLIFPAWTGISNNEMEHARRLAQLGFVAFVADTYGKGIRPTLPKEAGAEAAKYMKDRTLYRERARAGLEQLLKVPAVDTRRIAAIGYCFGGAGALELARSGADIKAVVVFHADLTSPTPQDDSNIKGHVLALHGADDPIVPAAEREKFAQEMRNAHVDWQLVIYGGAMHCFTDARASDTSHGCAYNAEAEKRSWRAMHDFFQDTL
jgi:dienelactone hydrolase